MDKISYMGTELLLKIGLTQNEIKVYECLLAGDSSTAGEIIKKTGLFRPRVYGALDRLVNKGLASFVTINNLKTFQAANPTRISDYILEKEVELRELRENELAKLISVLGKKRISPKTDIRVYMGFKGVKTALEDMLEELKEGKGYVAFAGGQFRPKMGIYYDKFQKTKKRLNVKSRFLYDESMRDSKEILDTTQGKWRFHEKKYHSPTDMFIFNDKVIITIWGAEPYFSILIQN